MQTISYENSFEIMLNELFLDIKKFLLKHHTILGYF